MGNAKSALAGLFLSLFLHSGSLYASDPSQVSFWYSESDQGTPIIHLYFFWSATCPHCQNALPFIQALPEQLPWLSIHDHPLSGSPANLETYISHAKKMHLQRIAVPGFMFCQRLETGFNDIATTGQFLIEELKHCYNNRLLAARHNISTQPGATSKRPEDITDKPFTFDPDNDEKHTNSAPLPVVGSIDTQRWSLPMLTLVLAGLDAFNPCAFFVLLFLLSLLAHAHSRMRMLIIGGVFVFFSGFIYFIFMAAWLNVFMFSGELRVATTLAALLAIFVGIVNSKDFFWYKKGISLSIPESAKPNLYRRMRGIISSGSMAAMLASTVVLAIVANSYELLCTAGFPMVYTRALTMQHLSTFDYYAYLIAYNIIYIIPLAVIVAVFTYTLGSHKLSEFGGRVLKLISGYMMLALGLLLLFSPELLANALVSFSVLALVILAAALTVFFQRHYEKRQEHS